MERRYAQWIREKADEATFLPNLIFEDSQHEFSFTINEAATHQYLEKEKADVLKTHK